MLSAQATDAGVNKATPALFAAADTPEKMAALGEDKVRDLIKTIGLYRNKAKNVVELSRSLVAEHGGQVPRKREALEALPGVGRKTANVVLNVAFGEPTIAVDTHIFRVGNRTSMAPGKDPFEVELKLEKRRARQIQAARASLADPARPLHLRRAQAAVREMHHQRSVPLAGEDGGLEQRASARLEIAFGRETHADRDRRGCVMERGRARTFPVSSSATRTRIRRSGSRAMICSPHCRKKPKRNPEQARAAETILRAGREIREAFMLRHAEAVYRALTKNLTAFVRADELAYAAAELVPGLMPTREQVDAQGDRMQSEKDGIEVDQGIFLAHILARPDTGTHLCHAMLLPRAESIAAAR